MFSDAHFEYTPSGKTMDRFHASEMFVRVALGPLGSGKTTGCCYEVLRRALEQAPDAAGVRRTRWLVCRETVPQLETTTLPSWRQHFGSELGSWKMSVPITHAWRFEVGDGTRVEADIYFMGLDGDDAVDKIRGMELTGAWVNECKDVPKSVIDMLTGRVGRFPSKNMGGPTWAGIIADTNMPEDDHWLYTLAEVSQPRDWEFFRQPGGVIKVGDQWVLNPLAENLQHLPEKYYERQLGGKADEWIRVFLAAEYGYVSDGRPVYPEYSDVHHVAEFDFVPGVEILVGCDFGLVPAAVFCQQDAWGRLWVLDELLPEDIGAKAFAIEVKKFIASHYPNATIGGAWGDPIGEKRQQGNEDIMTTFQIMAVNGFKCKPAPGNNELVLRREAVVGMLTRFVDGKPGLIINRRCVRLRAGMSGKYCFKRVQQKGEVFADKPNKNTGHADICESLQYLCLGLGEGRQVIKDKQNMRGGKLNVITGTKFSHHKVGQRRRPPRFGARQ
jgi:hypothetical protein